MCFSAVNIPKKYDQWNFRKNALIMHGYRKIITFGHKEKHYCCLIELHMYLFLVESLIRVMYWVVAAILNWLFKPLNINILHNICTHICELRCIVYTLPF